MRDVVEESLGSLLRRFRVAAGLSQEEVAERAGLSAKAISALETGVRRRPHPQTLRSLVTALGLSPEQRALLLMTAARLQSGTRGRPNQALVEISSTPDAAARLADARMLLTSIPTDALPAQAPLPPGSRMPLAPNPLFVGRGAELLQLAAMLKGGGTTVALGQVVASTGMGGLGKTQLAVELVHRYGRFFAGGVFWLSFASADEIPLQVAACAAPGLEERSLEERVHRVQRAWQSAVPRLLVFDNCEEETLLQSWRPTSGGCQVLVTSRRSHWTPTLGVVNLPLDTLPRPDSIELLRRFRPDLSTDAPGLGEVAHEVGDLPLALHLAGSFLHRYRHELGPEGYVAQLRQPDAVAHASLLGRGLSPDLSPTRHVQNVAQTFAMSYARLLPADEVDARALALLAGAARLAPGEPIPRDLLLGRSGSAETRLLDADALARVGSLGLVETAGDDLRLHRLVVHFLKDASSDEAALAPVEASFVEAGLLAAESEAAGPRLSAIITHLNHLARAAGTAADPRAGTLWHALGRALHAAADFGSAGHALDRALAIREQALGPDHEDTAACSSDLGEVLVRQGRWAEARRRLEAALTVRERVLVPEHPETAATLHGLALALQGQGEMAAARRVFERALGIRKQALGPDDRRTARSLNDLAFLHRELSELDVARALLERAIDIRERTLGPDHAETAMSLNDLGLVLWDGGDTAGGRALLERAVAIQERALGLDHPDTATSINNLGAVVRAQGRPADALVLFERALAIRERVLGPDHPHTAQSLNNVAGPLQDQGRLDAARPFRERALAIRQRVLGDEHPDTAQSLHNLALLLRDQGDLDEAQPLLIRAIAIWERSLGPDHPTVGIADYSLATVLTARGEGEAARWLCERAAAIFDRALGPDHPRTVRARSNLAVLSANQPAAPSPAQPPQTPELRWPTSPKPC